MATVATVTITLIDREDGDFRLLIESSPPVDPDHMTAVQSIALGIRDIVAAGNRSIGTNVPVTSHDVLGHDGWQHATLYHTIMEHAERGEAYLIMPDVRRDPDDTCTALAVAVPYTAMGPCFSPYEDQRARGHVGAQLGAHIAAQEYLDNQ